MKKIYFVLIVLAAASSLACLSTAAQISPGPTGTPTIATNLVSGPVDQVIQDATATLKPTAEADVCAVITADESLHLRLHSRETSLHLAYMLRGEVVRLISASDPDWWLIEREGVIGYARAKYLQRGECE